MVILMQGIFSSKNIVPIPALARALAKEGRLTCSVILCVTTQIAIKISSLAQQVLSAMVLT
jgi:hypothetical protein